MQKMRVRSLGREDLLEKDMATHSSIRAWRIPWTEEPGALQSMGSQREGHNWRDWPYRFLSYPRLYFFPKRESFSLLSYVDLDPTLSVLVRFLACGIYLAIYEVFLFEVFFFNPGGFKQYFFKYFSSIFIFFSPSRVGFVQVLGRDPFIATLQNYEPKDSSHWPWFPLWAIPNNAPPFLV